MSRHLIRPIPMDDLVMDKNQGISVKLTPEAFSVSLREHYNQWVERSLASAPAYIGYDTRDLYKELIDSVLIAKSNYTTVIYNLTYFSQLKDIIWKLELRGIPSKLIVYFAIAYLAETKVLGDKSVSVTVNYLLKYTLKDTVNLDIVFKSRILDFYFGLGLIALLSLDSIDEKVANTVKKVIDRIVTNSSLYSVYLEEQSSKIKE